MRAQPRIYCIKKFSDLNIFVGISWPLCFNFWPLLFYLSTAEVKWGRAGEHELGYDFPLFLEILKCAYCLSCHSLTWNIIRTTCSFLFSIKVFVCAQSCLIFATHGLYPSRLLCPWKFPGNNAGVGCHFLPQRSS